METLVFELAEAADAADAAAVIRRPADNPELAARVVITIFTTAV